MDKKLFNELIEGVREMKAIEEGTSDPVRLTRMEKSEVHKIRHGIELYQSGFSRMMGISLRTLQNWEQGHRSPVGSAKILLRIAKKHPKVVLDAASR